MTMPVGNYKNLAFSTQFRYEHIAIKSHASFSVGAFGVQTITIAHNLGYKPFVKGAYTYTGNPAYFTLFAGPASFGIGGNGGQIDSFYADTANLYIQVSENSGGTISGIVYYRIYAEPQA